MDGAVVFSPITHGANTDDLALAGGSEGIGYQRWWICSPTPSILARVVFFDCKAALTPPDSEYFVVRENGREVASGCRHRGDYVPAAGRDVKPFYAPGTTATVIQLGSTEGVYGGPGCNYGQVAPGGWHTLFLGPSVCPWVVLMQFVAGSKHVALARHSSHDVEFAVESSYGGA
jgi:hypothetical protein